MLRAKLFAVPFLALSAATLALPAHAYGDDAAAAADAMEDSWTIVQNAASSPEHRIFAQAVTAAGLAETLGGEGPFTVFAPTDAAFAAVPQPMTDYLMNPANQWALEQVLTYHVVPGAVTAEDLYSKIEAGGGSATLTTVEGEALTFTEVQGNIKVDGTQGSSGYVTRADLDQANGVIHVLNGVLIPTLTPPAAEPAEPAADAPAAESETAG
ncbi:MAG TPA: fasciclin domain-containing protein [Sphingopyxis sp.]|mgnify:CR=1 FL=1|nr:fasciclin domain-containing protein [Sphingopyxis sp.]HMP46898.1 fasciclin domain-containing protein [Sphingopyxis sp.]HMQ18233.1 fasciclin domain-containing protein [Sphingopyxis sp.]